MFVAKLLRDDEEIETEELVLPVFQGHAGLGRTAAGRRLTKGGPRHKEKTRAS